MSVNSTHLLALATAFQRSLEGHPEDWTQLDRFGPLRVLIVDEVGVHPAFLAMVHAGLRRAFRAFENEPDAWFKDSRTSADIAHAVATSFGVGAAPSAANALARAKDSKDDASNAAIAKRLRDWRARVITSPMVLREADAVVAEHVPRTLTDETGRAVSASLLWGFDSVEEWPPAAEEEWFIQRLQTQLGGLPTELHDVPQEYAHILRRRTWEVWDSYVPGDAEHQRRNTHAVHHVFRVWHREDRFDLRPHGIDLAPQRVSADATFRQSQATLLQLCMQRAALEWDAVQYAAIIDLRARNAHAIGSLQQRLFASAAGSKVGVRSSTFETTVTMPVYNGSLADATPSVAHLHRLSRDVRTNPTDLAIETYLKTREAMSENLPGYGKLDGRIILISDQSVHLDTHKHPRRDFRERADANLFETAGIVAPVFRAYQYRDGALAASHQRNLEVATARAVDGYHLVTETGENSSRTDQERDLLEAEQQILLQLTGLFSIRLEDALEHSTLSARTDRWSEDVAVANVSALLRWSSWLVAVTDELEAEGHLSEARLKHLHLGEPTWIASSHLYRHRALCAAMTVALTYGLRFGIATARTPELRQLSLDDLRTAYLRMVALPHMTEDIRNKVQQSALWHAFLDGATVPNAVDVIGDPLRGSDHLLAVNVDGSIPETVDFSHRGNALTVASGRLSRNGWDFGAIGRIPLRSTAARALDRTSGGTFSAWRTIHEVEQTLNAQISRR